MTKLEKLNDVNIELVLRACPFRALAIKVLSDILEIEIKSMAEIGVYWGKHAMVLRKFFPKAQLYLIDPWQLSENYIEKGGTVCSEQKHMTAAKNLVLDIFSQDKNAHVICATSEDGSKRVDGPLDLVFIDGDHSYEHVKQDIELWLPKLRKGGILAGHDYGHPDLPDVKRAVDEAFGDNVIVGGDYTWFKIV